MIKDKSLLKWKLTKQQNEKEWVRAGGDMNRWMWFCQSFVLVSDPQRGTFTSMVIRSVSVWVSVSIRAVQKEGGSSRVSGCWSWIEFWQVTPSKGPAGSVEDVLPWTWTPELISSSFNQFYGCLRRFHFFWKCTGVNAWEWNSYEYKTGGEFIQGHDCKMRCGRLESICILVHSMIKCRPLTVVLHRYHFCHFLHTVGQPWQRKTEDKLLQTITARQTILNQNWIQFIYWSIQSWTIIQTAVTR